MIYLDKNEILEILICTLALALGFTIAFAGLGALFSSPIEFALFFILSIVCIGSGFILHEMSHKLVALYYGAHARFKMWFNGLVIMLVGATFGILFAAPGAVYIYAKKISLRANGIISLAGPATNFILVLFFLFLNSVLPLNQYFSFLTDPLPGFGLFYGVVHVWRFAAALNLVLGLFNLIPAFPLDGSKVFYYSKLLWILSILSFFALGFFASIISLLYAIAWFVMLMLAVVLSRVAFGNPTRFIKKE